MIPQQNMSRESQMDGLSRFKKTFEGTYAISMLKAMTMSTSRRLTSKMA